MPGPVVCPGGHFRTQFLNSVILVRRSRILLVKLEKFVLFPLFLRFSFWHWCVGNFSDFEYLNLFYFLAMSLLCAPMILRDLPFCHQNFCYFSTCAVTCFLYFCFATVYNYSDIVPFLIFGIPLSLRPNDSARLPVNSCPVSFLFY